MDLLIVESPTKARTLGRFLPKKQYSVVASVGHVRDLPKSKLGVDVDKDFEPEYEISRGKTKVISEIKQLVKKADRVFLATDPDREGEAISWHIYEVLTEGKKNLLKGKDVRRVTFHEITQSAVEHALEDAHQINEDLVDAQQARRVVDRLVGYSLSPVLWKKVRRGLSAGRVQSVAVRLIVEKEREREAFKPVEFWDIYSELDLVKGDAVFPKEKGRDSFLAKLEKRDGKKLEVGDEVTAWTVQRDLSVADYVVKSIAKKESLSRPSPPFTTSTMQQTAGQRFGYSAKRTMSLAQRLYEKGLITYHRTDAMNLSKEAVEAGRGFVASEYGDKYLPSKPNVYKTKAKVAQEAHEAIRPTDVYKKPGDMDLEGAEKKLYELIWKRFVACQMVPAVFDKTDIEIEADAERVKYSLGISGRVRKFDGYLRAYGGGKADDELPHVSEGGELGLMQVWGNQRFTEPPARFSEATLIKQLEQLGIGRPSTYAPTLSTIQDRNYVERVDGRLVPTVIGTATNDFLVKNFPTELDYEFTAHMENDLDEIANGDKQWKELVKNFYGKFANDIEEAEGAERVQVPTESTGEPCPDCAERKAYVESGGKDLESFETTYEKEAAQKTAEKQKKLVEEGKKKRATKKKQEPTTATNGELVIRVGRFGKFLSCSEFPDCRYIGRYEEKIDMACPECGDVKEGQVIVKKTKRGRTFFGCNRYPECEWASWKKPGVE